MSDIITFKATDKQILEMAALATNASFPPPGSPGWIHYQQDAKFEGEDFAAVLKEQRMLLHLDYVQGRCVKMILWRGKKRHEWQYRSNEPQNNWQTWIGEYPTYPDLMRAAGIDV